MGNRDHCDARMDRSNARGNLGCAASRATALGMGTMREGKTKDGKVTSFEKELVFARGFLAGLVIAYVAYRELPKIYATAIAEGWEWPELDNLRFWN